ncbi:MAG: DUF4184 family protein [Acidobacteriales bacterium]|nr:DUF4184 family protein [Terriglobales bacterium]
MPFTFAHAAAGIPFRRARLAWSAFFVGSFAPDFEYFLRLGPQNSYAHRWPGVALFTFPAACIALVLYELFVREMLVSMLPPGTQTKIPPPRFRVSLGHVALTLASIALGIATHIFWDGFTHSWSWATDLWPSLMRPVELPIFGVRPLTELLQGLSSVFGMGAVIIWSLRWLSNAAPDYAVRSASPRRWRTAAYLCSVAVILASISRALTFTQAPLEDVGKFLVLVTVNIIGLLWWCLLAAGIIRRVTIREAGR